MTAEPIRHLPEIDPESIERAQKDNEQAAETLARNLKLDISAANLVEVIQQALRPKPLVSFTKQQQALWDDAVRKDAPDPRGAVLRSAQRHAEFIANCWDGNQVARHLGRQPATIRSYSHNKQLASFLHGGKLRYPDWQFTETGVLPELGNVLSRLPENLPVLAMAGFFTNDQTIDLFMGGHRVSPRDWLAAGRGAEAVIPYAEGLKSGL